MFGRGQEYHVTASLGKSMKDSPCVRCGRCVDVCPTGALYMQESIDRMLHEAHSYTTVTVGMVSSSVLKGLEDLSGMQNGSLDIHRVIGGMKKLGVDAVVSEEEVIDANGMEAEEIISGASGPVMISNSFAVRNFIDQNYPELASRVQYYQSVQECFHDMAKTKLAERFGWNPSDIRTVMFTGNNENGAEAHEKQTADFSLNAREIYRTFMRTGVSLQTIRSSDPVRLHLEKDNDFRSVTGPIDFNYKKEPEVLKACGKKCAVAHNLGQTRALLDEVVSGTSTYDVIRLCA